MRRFSARNARLGIQYCREGPTLTALPTAQLAPVEHFSVEETQFLTPFVTNTHLPVFALTNLPEVVKGALFARYSRTAKSLRRLLLDEFRGDLVGVDVSQAGEQARAERLYDRVFGDYGDDSIAQLGSVHVACEGVSNVVTKLLERGRLMSYLEQSTRYVPYTDRPEGRWKYHTPIGLDRAAKRLFSETMDASFSIYAEAIPKIEAFLLDRLVSRSETPSQAFRRAVRAKALDLLRGLLPAATRSNVGVYGSGQAYEMLVMRLRASGNSEASIIADLLLHELRKVIPAFVARVDRLDRGVVWTRYLEDVRVNTLEEVERHTGDVVVDDTPEVTLIDYDPEGELKVVAAAMYRQSGLSDRQLLEISRDLSESSRAAILSAYVGDRSNRRHRPGRAFERTSYRFDILGDYAAFRDLQRHRLLTIDWQTLTPTHGYVIPPIIEQAGLDGAWHEVMERGAHLYYQILAVSPQDAAYAVPMAYRIRYNMDMNAREAMHVIELRSAEQGHESYRRIAQRMHELIRTEAGHSAIASAMRFVNYARTDLERLRAEEGSEQPE